jgi:hypothetical protein
MYAHPWDDAFCSLLTRSPDIFTSHCLTFFRTYDMVFRMKTTLIIPDPVFRDLKRNAAKRGTTMSELAAELLRKGLDERPKPSRLPPLPSFNAGRILVDVADRDALYDVLDAERDARLYGRARKKD